MDRNGRFPKLGVGVPFWVISILRIIIFCGLHWGPPILGNYHIGALSSTASIMACLVKV